MAFSIEARPPFLSKEVVELAFGIPDSTKMNLVYGKRIIRDSYKKDIPRKVIRRRKTGLVSPIDDLLRGELRSFLYQSITESKSDSLLNINYINLLMKEHFSGKANHGYKLYLILVYLRWIKLFICE